MAILHTYNYLAHKNIYSENGTNYKTRKIRVEISFPDCRNKSTGILVLVPGYGGNIDSHVFRKMREKLADEYNMAIVQCDYFGNSFMKDIIPEELNKVLEIENILEAHIIYKQELNETVKDFNDMGLMQALDIVSSTLCSMKLMTDKGYIIEPNRVYIFGTSHGAYLAHLANIICPELFSGLIDISAYIYPYYMKNRRSIKVKLVSKKGSKLQVSIVNEYLIMNDVSKRYSSKLYDLSFLYQNCDNRCKIIAIQGTEDWMVDAEEKKDFILQIENADIMLITPEEVDGILCKNAGHGLGIDFFELFKIVIPALDKQVKRNKKYVNLPQNVKIGNSEAYIIITYETGLPEIIDLTW